MNQPNKYRNNAGQLKEEQGQKEQQQQKQVERKQRVRAGVCPRVARHGNGRVYKTAGRKRYCVCDECGHTWTKAGEQATQEVD